MLLIDETRKQSTSTNMNIFECIPGSFSFHTPLYWTQAASIQMLPTNEAFLGISSMPINSKSMQLPLDLTCALFKNQSTASIERTPKMNAKNKSSLSESTQRFSPVMSCSGDLCQQQHLNNHLRQQRQRQLTTYHQLGQPSLSISTSSSPIGGGLAPLKALCDSDVTVLSGRSPSMKSADGTNKHKEGLKFGIKRILSDDFGKFKHEKENNFLLNDIPKSYRSLPLCPCDSPTCTTLVQRSIGVRTHISLPNVSAGHALQPPNYPFGSAVDVLPGPYSVLSTDSCNSNQPKRKRSWSRAVFSNLQRKGLEKRFEQQKYVTKPDRRQLASMLGLTDAQVKVWFQNRRMKWRHSQQQGIKVNQRQQESESSLGITDSKEKLDDETTLKMDMDQ